MQDKVVVIFGGSGKLGQQFSKTLRNNGAKVYVLDIKKRINEKDISFLKCDVQKKII